MTGCTKSLENHLYVLHVFVLAITCNTCYTNYMERGLGMNFKQAEKMVQNDGWRHTYTSGSHYHYRHPVKPGKVTIPNHGSKELHPKVIKSIKRQAGLE